MEDWGPSSRTRLMLGLTFPISELGSATGASWDVILSAVLKTVEKRRLCPRYLERTSPAAQLAGNQLAASAT